MSCLCVGEMWATGRTSSVIPYRRLPTRTQLLRCLVATNFLEQRAGPRLSTAQLLDECEFEKKTFSSFSHRLLSRSRIAHPHTSTNGTWFIGIDVSPTSTGIVCRWVPAGLPFGHPGEEIHFIYLPQLVTHRYTPIASCGEHCVSLIVPSTPEAPTVIDSGTHKRKRVEENGGKSGLAVQRVRMPPVRPVVLDAHAQQLLAIPLMLPRAIWHHRLESVSHILNPTAQQWRTANQIVDRIKLIVGDQAPRRVFIEDYVRRQHNKQSAAHSIAEITGVIKNLLHANEFSFAPINNQTIKKHFGAARGGSDKHDMWVACARKYPVVTRFLEDLFKYDHVRQMSEYQVRYRSLLRDWEHVKLQDSEAKMRQSLTASSSSSENPCSILGGGFQEVDDQFGINVTGEECEDADTPPAFAPPDVPSPQNDLIDAFALSLHDPVAHAVVTKSKKRRIDASATATSTATAATSGVVRARRSK